MRTRWLALVVASMVVAIACRDRPATSSGGGATGSSSNAPPVGAPPPSEPAMAGDWASPLGDASIYDLELSVLDAAGDVRTLSSFDGASVLITMFYASCPAACPRLIDDLKGIEQQLAPEVRERTQIVLVSFDPARDTPAALRELAAERDLGPRWTLTAADDATARELAAALGIKYRVLDGGEFFHTSVITALDEHGRSLARVEGLGRDADVIVAALR